MKTNTEKGVNNFQKEARSGGDLCAYLLQQTRCSEVEGWVRRFHPAIVAVLVINLSM